MRVETVQHTANAVRVVQSGFVRAGWLPEMSESDWKRLWSRVTKTDTCWVWTGAGNGRGYGRLNFRGKMLYPHRIVAAYALGPIPDGMVIDHLCRNRACVRPEHLEIVTMGENTRRGMDPRVVAYRAGTCLRGHSRAEYGYVWPRTGQVFCRQCRRDRRAAARARGERAA